MALSIELVSDEASAHLFLVTVGNKRIFTTVTSSLENFEQWLENVYNHRKMFPAERVVGMCSLESFDERTRTFSSNPGVIAICYYDFCLIFQLRNQTSDHRFSKALHKFINFRRLAIFTTNLHRRFSALENQLKRPSNITFLGDRHMTDCETKRSNWGRFVLSAEQVLFACFEAYRCFESGVQLGPMKNLI